MAKRKCVYVECFGGIWRLSRRGWSRLLKDIAEDVDFDLDDYGKQITPAYQSITDLTPTSAREILALETSPN